MEISSIQAIQWTDDGVVLIDQRSLPIEEKYITYTTVDSLAKAIRDLVVRGAPAIGITAAFGIALGIRSFSGDKDLDSKFEHVCRILENTRPTAQYLFWSIERMRCCFRNHQFQPIDQIKKKLVEEALAIQQEDIEINRTIIIA